MANLNPTTTGTAAFQNAQAIYYDRYLLERLEAMLHFDEFGEKRKLPKASGNQIRFTRYNNFAAVTTSLTEGVVPDGEVLSSTQIFSTPVEYGQYVTLSDFLIMESIDPVIKGALEVLSYQGALSYDTIVRNSLHGNVTNRFAGGAANEGAVSTVISASEIRIVAKVLKTANVRPFGDSFASIIHPATSFDLQSDSAVGSWLDLNKYTTTGPTYKGEIGKIYGVRFVESANIQTGVGAASATTYRNFVFGKQAYGLVDLAGNNLKTYIKQLGTSGAFDPLDQLATVGYKFALSVPILDAVRAVELIGISNAP